MPATYEPIATTTLSVGASSIIFSSIPATYTDLRLVVVAFDGATDLTTFNLFARYQTAANYSQTRLIGDGSAASSNRITSTSLIHLTSATTLADNTTTPTMAELDIFNYAGSTFKTALVRTSNDQNGSGSLEYCVSLWQDTSAINELRVLAGGGMNLKAGTTATLYGILKA